MNIILNAREMILIMKCATERTLKMHPCV